jgi:type II secretory pathway pseudopilin PulG
MIVLQKKQGRRGVTLIEAVLFISIALGLIVGGLVFFQQASLAARTNDAVRSISSIASETRAAYRTQDDFSGLDASVLISAGAVPTSQIDQANDEIISEWNTEVTVSGSAVNINGEFDPAPAAALNEFFVITYFDIPEAACTRLTTASDGNGPIGPGIVTVFVEDSAGTPATHVPTDGTNDLVDLNGRVTITPGQAATMCGAGPSPVTVSWVLAR